jgi:hypothetical protein
MIIVLMACIIHFKLRKKFDQNRKNFLENFFYNFDFKKKLKKKKIL